MYKIPIVLFSSLLIGCASLSSGPQNYSGLEVKIEVIKNHIEGVDVTISLQNTTQQTMRIYSDSPVTLLLEGKYRVKGKVVEAIEVWPSSRKTATLQFRFINSPRIYKTALLEITPTKIFATCNEANEDTEVVREVDSTNDREPALTIEPTTCNRTLKRPIRVSF